MLTEHQKQSFKFFADSFIHSYAQMFFSDNRAFAYMILLASFINPWAGLSGALAVIISVLVAYWLGLNRLFIQSGAYSANSLMVGLMMGLYFNFSIPFFVILMVMAIFTTILSNAIGIVFSKYQLPVFMLPFTLSIWALLLALRSSSAVTLNSSGLYVHNELYSIAGVRLVHLYEFLDGLHLPAIVDTYLKSLGAIYSQYNIISGLFIAIGLLIYSRIAFTLSILGFAAGYYFFQFMHGSNVVDYNFIGFNYILAAISIGGFFFIPSPKSYFLALLSAPMIAVLFSATSSLFEHLQLPVYSLPFNVVLILLLLTLKHRSESKGLTLVQLQQFSPEKNLYKHLTRAERFQNETYYHIQLPFFGEWYVSQGNDGKITHIGDWKYAWDFVVTDDMKHTFRLPGTSVTDYFCYNAPVLAPAAGYVYSITDDVDDNLVGDVDVQQNWGNTIIIKHAEYLYSKISHIKKGSFKVRAGDHVRKGDLIAACGNSGRSPEPHIHFQLQSTPFIGSKTLRYPISYYVERKEGQFNFRSFDYPAELSSISGITINTLLKSAFTFTPGQTFKFEVTAKANADKKEIVKWEVFTDAFNHTYIFCHNTKSLAYFVNNGTLHYFTEFYGDKNSLLHQFYLGSHKILLGYYEHLKIADVLPIHNFYSGFAGFIQDFVSPFYMFLRANYVSKFVGADDPNNPNRINLIATATVNLATQKIRQTNFEFEIADSKIQSFKVLDGPNPMTAVCIS